MILYYAEDGTIVAASSGGQPNDADTSFRPQGATRVLYLSDTEYADVYANSTRYKIINGEPVLQPYFTVEETDNTITVTLNNPPSPAPTSCSISIGSTTITETLTNNSCTLNLAIHPSVASQRILIRASASGCVDGILFIGGQSNDIALQAYLPTGSTTYTVAPCGQGSRSFLESYYALSPADIQSLLADIGTAVNLLTDAVFNVILPALQNQTYTPISLTANQSNAMADIKANVLSNLFTTLSNVYPSGGSKQLQYEHYTNDLSKTYVAFEQYMNDLDSIPNLQ
ncbi:hypothetical protein [Alicyclobacillus fastidiosus]|uniref:Uncharacterized protein n=1 Tax=Alicyclobacillus fastidiosus TaxID=392011 RepID=A0ABV5AKJ0_9BACL|nr:hypothetical protein [Alicyclobacillus fastidiosus]WEH08468.1 hypothetical protein PYS47_17495 [Alicyclobacillus fastidiosus]